MGHDAFAIISFALLHVGSPKHLQNNDRWALSRAPYPTGDALLAVAGLLQRGHGSGQVAALHEPEVPLYKTFGNQGC